MKPAIVLATYAVLALANSSAAGYELTSHAFVTREAFRVFASERPLALQSLGLSDRTTPTDESTSLGNVYFDVWQSVVDWRMESDFEAPFLRNLSVDRLSVIGWVMRGAIREDDLTWGNPQDDYFGNFIRVTNHFFDPAFNRGLWSYPRASDWAIGTNDAFAQPNVVNYDRDRKSVV